MQNKKTTKFILAALLASMSMSAFSGCGEATSDGVGDSSSTPPTDDSSVAEELPYDFAVKRENNNDAIINILVPKHAEYEFMVEESSGDIVEDAIYNRNRKTEEWLGVKMTFESRPDFAGSDADNFNKLVRQAVQSDDDSYQIIDGINVFTVKLIPDGIFADLASVDTINLENPWYVPGYPLNGRVYYTFTDAALSLYKDLYVMFFNRNMVEDMKLQDPYALALDGKWTLDSFISKTKDIAMDLDGDNEIDSEKDRIAYVYKHAANRSLLPSTGCTIVENTKDGKYTLSALSERLVNTYDKLKVFLDKKNPAVSCSTEADYVLVAKPFIEGRALFCCNCLCTVEGMRNMKDDFGILPMPKYDEAQENYRSQIATSTSAFYMPVTVRDKELVGKVIETLSYYSHIDVVGKYYEIALKDKYTRDDHVRETLDIIRDGAVSSFEFAYSTLFDSTWPNNILDFAADGKEISSFWAQNENSWRKKIESLGNLEVAE